MKGKMMRTTRKIIFLNLVIITLVCGTTLNLFGGSDRDGIKCPPTSDVPIFLPRANADPTAFLSVWNSSILSDGSMMKKMDGISIRT